MPLKRLVYRLGPTVVVAYLCLACHEYVRRDSWLRTDDRVIHTVPGWHVVQAVVWDWPGGIGPRFYAARESVHIRTKLELDSMRVFRPDTAGTSGNLLGSFTVECVDEQANREIILCEPNSTPGPWELNLCTHVYTGQWFARAQTGDTVLIESFCRTRGLFVTEGSAVVVLTSCAVAPSFEESQQHWHDFSPDRYDTPDYIDDPYESLDSLNAPIYETTPVPRW